MARVHKWLANSDSDYWPSWEELSFLWHYVWHSHGSRPFEYLHRAQQMTAAKEASVPDLPGVKTEHPPFPGIQTKPSHP